MNIEKITLTIMNDPQIQALNQNLNDLYEYSIPKYIIIQSDGEIRSVRTKQFEDAFAETIKVIKSRREQIISECSILERKLIRIKPEGAENEKVKKI